MTIVIGRRPAQWAAPRALATAKGENERAASVARCQYAADNDRILINVAHRADAALSLILILNRQAETLNVAAGLLKRIQARNIHARNQQVDIVGALVGQYRFEVHHMAHHRIFVGDTHAAVYLPRLAGDLQRHVYVIPLGHTDLRGGSLAGVGQGTQTPGQELGFRDFGVNSLLSIIRCTLVHLLI